MVQSGEDRELCEFRHPRYHQEPYECGVVFQPTVKVVKEGVDLFQFSRIVEESLDRRVIFVDQDDDLSRWGFFRNG